MFVTCRSFEVSCFSEEYSETKTLSGEVLLELNDVFGLSTVRDAVGYVDNNEISQIVAVDSQRSVFQVSVSIHLLVADISP